METLNQALFLSAAVVAFTGSLLVLAVEHRISAPWMPLLVRNYHIALRPRICRDWVRQ
ncbi:MAG: hypothetical protein WBO95_10820 [Candidatus Dechloromonas phosphoritropha]|jgi:hypothetical protein